MIQSGSWLLAAFLAAWAGVLDWRYRRIPNWLTVPGLLAGIAVNTAAAGWAGAKSSLLGAGLGLAVLLPFVLMNTFGAGDWKLATAFGAILGPGLLASVLIATVFVNGALALGVVLYKGRFWQTMRNIGHILGRFLSLHLPGPEFSLDNPESVKIPFGVAMALTVLLWSVGRALGRV